METLSFASVPEPQRCHFYCCLKRPLLYSSTQHIFIVYKCLDMVYRFKCTIKYSIIDCRSCSFPSFLFLAVSCTCFRELPCQQDISWASFHVFLTFKRVIDLTKACIEMWRTKTRPDAAVFDETSFIVQKKQICTSLCSHQNTDCVFYECSAIGFN